MHIILGILGTLVTLLILINRLSDAGIDIGWLNPFSWARRRKFRKEYQLHPAYTLESPMDVAALFLVSVAKVDGDMTKGQKEKVLALFTREFSLSEKEAYELLTSSVHIFGRGDDVLDNPSKVLSRSIERFSAEQIESLIKMLHEVAIAEGEPSAKQLGTISKIEKALPKAKQVH